MISWRRDVGVVGNWSLYFFGHGQTVGCSQVLLATVELEGEKWAARFAQAEEDGHIGPGGELIGVFDTAAEARRRAREQVNLRIVEAQGQSGKES